MTLQEAYRVLRRYEDFRLVFDERNVVDAFPEREHSQPITDCSFLSPVKPFVGYWEIRYLKNGAFRLVQLDSDDWIDYNPKAQWAEERNQNCGCQLVKEV